jgi:glycosyltransferase involved in cell wall biosynthesis
VRIAFDVTPLSHRRTGVGNYIRGSLRGLVESAAGEHEIVAFAPTSRRGAELVAEALDGIDVERRIRTLPFAHAWRTAWSRLGRPPAERFLGRFDVLQFADWMYPPQRGGVRATMVHDLVPLRFPEWVHPRTRRMHGAKYRNAARTCDVVFTNSEYTANDVVELLGVARDRVRVARPGVDEGFAPEGDRADLGRPYLFTVATLEPRKNLDTLVEAYRLLGDDVALAIAGAAGWGPQPALEAAGIVRLGYVANAELPRWYRGAAISVYPSRFEGFGMPVVESMACGVPCVASAHASLDEACGDAAIRVDPDDPQAIAAGIREALARRDELVPRGLEHARQFTWRSVGETMLAGYRGALEGL